MAMSLNYKWRTIRHRHRDRLFWSDNTIRHDVV